MSAAQLAARPQHADLPEVLHLRTPMPGLAGYEEFTLSSLDDTGALFALRSEPVGARPVRLFVVDPAVFFPDYAPTLDPAVLAGIGADGDSVRRLVVVRPAADGQPPTANLLAPLLVEPSSGATVQAVLTEDWPLRAPLGQTA